MTKNQIEYQKLLETKRANLAQEAISTRGQDLSHKVQMGTLDESRRHNLAAETETSRHNRTVESQAMDVLLHNEKVLAETVRSNKAKEKQNSRSIDETIRSNKVREEETQRSNLARESETRRSNVAQELELHRANTARELENFRSNKARENETFRSNRAREKETNRANVESERLKSQGLRVDMKKASDLALLQHAQRDLINQQAAQVSRQTELLTDENARKWIDLGVRSADTIQDNVHQKRRAKWSNFKTLVDMFGNKFERIVY